APSGPREWRFVVELLLPTTLLLLTNPLVLMRAKDLLSAQVIDNQMQSISTIRGEIRPLSPALQLK
ncbi:unnamed protein product, partial [Prorocentrum cordatum]